MTIDRLVGNIHFDYDRSVLRGSSPDVVPEMADVLLKDNSRRYLITGYTDARGTL